MFVGGTRGFQQNQATTASHCCVVCRLGSRHLVSARTLASSEQLQLAVNEEQGQTQNERSKIPTLKWSSGHKATPYYGNFFFQLNSCDSGQTHEFTQVYRESTKLAKNVFASELTHRDQVNS